MMTNQLQFLATDMCLLVPFLYEGHAKSSKPKACSKGDTFQAMKRPWMFILRRSRTSTRMSGGGIQKWFERMRKCIDCNGIYFEKYKNIDQSVGLLFCLNPETFSMALVYASNTVLMSYLYAKA